MSTPSPSPGRVLAISVAVCLGVAVVQTWGAWTSSVPVLVGGGMEPDWTGTAWAWWWTWEALLQGANPVAGGWNLWPVGHAPVAQYNLVDATVLGWAIHVLGPTRGYNLGCLLTLASTGVAGARLARVAGASWKPALVGGLALQCSSYLACEVSQGRVGQALIAFLVLAFAELVRLSRGEGTRWHPVMVGALAALTALSYWFYGLFLAFAALPFVLGGLARAPKTIAPRLMGAVATCLVLCAPALWALAAVGDDLAGLGRPYTADLVPVDWTQGKVGLAMAMGDSPYPWWPLDNASIKGIQRRPGLVLLGLVGLALWRAPKGTRWPWVCTLAIGWVLSLGPWVRVAPRSWLPIPLPWLALDAIIPYFGRLWWPRRWEVVVLLATTPLVALAVQGVRRRWVVVVLTIGMFAELFTLTGGWPVKAEAPPHYDPVLYSGTSGPLLTMPLAAPVNQSRFVLWMQIIHGQPVSSGLGDHLDGHRPARWLDYIDSNAVLDTLRDAGTEEMGTRTIQPQDVEDLTRDGFGWAVLDPQALPSQGRGAWVRRYALILTAIWGQPEVTRPGGAARWKLHPIDGPRQTPKMGRAPPIAPPSRTTD